ncbi:anhydrase 1 [Seminavis robusta]|uniref:carbonic anhydrase n=1 Tax=Seminavis robusta TaxID=568900 RepID=A0A9N8HL07_9STRA|nr:anhydrase 1 [Seminavis robusta]|eukprot:Sro878_g214750.1 anhydrase 1 (525) ;mRNA; r:22451-24234
MVSFAGRRRCRLMVGLFGILLVPIAARSWIDIVDPLELTLHDSALDFRAFEDDPFLDMETTTAPPFGPFPTSGASPGPPPTHITLPPTKAITPEPTVTPETPLPTASPTIAPTIETTPAPTINPYPENPVPDFPDPSYFNYDPNRSNPYGPGYPQLQRYNQTTLVVGYENNGWAITGVPANFYWNEFDDEKGSGPWQGVLAVRRPERNLCDRIGEQSPIDVRPSGATCEEHHQIRVRPGDFKVSGAEVEKQIHPNKLRLKYQRRPCADPENELCAEPDPPHADFPHNWGGYADLMHIDFKVPSEHMINGTRYDAEMQLVHMHPSRRRTPTVSVMIQATPKGYNYYLQAALDAFEYVYNVHRAQCAAKRRKERQLMTDIHQLLGENASRSGDAHAKDFNTWAHFSTDLDDPDFERNRKLQERLLQNGVWDPHHIQLVPSIYFYGYEGSLTEPPCGEWVTWFICDSPMIISTSQLEQMKKLIFSHIDGDCNPTSVHYKQSVARPIQDSGGRPVWHCTQDDFLPDNF